MKEFALDQTHDRSTHPERDPAAHQVHRKVFRKASSGSEAGQQVEPVEGGSGFSTALNTGLGHGVSSLVSRAAEETGHALPDSLRGSFESSLGTDLGGVRVHTGGAAAAAANALDARAYAVGQDVFMGAGQYNPDSSDGAFLLAHEVAHTVQQRGASTGPQFKLEVSQPGDALETAADDAAAAMIAGRPTSVGAVAAGIHRAPHGHGETRAASLSPAQQRALGQVEHGGRNLHTRSLDDLIGIVRTLSAAHGASQGDQRARVARALVQLYDAVDQHLGDEFNNGGDARMAWEIPELSMIDPWEQDAHAPHGRRHRPHRRQQPRVNGGTPARETPTAQGGAAPPQVDPNQAANDATRGMQGPRVAEDPNHLGHQVAQGAEILHTALAVTELVVEFGPWALALGLVSAGVASIVGPAAQLHAAEEFTHACQRSMRVVQSFCIGFADGVRGQPASGPGARVGQQTRTAMLAHGVTAAQIQQMSGIWLYGLCWSRIHQHVVDELVHIQESGLMGTQFAAANAVPNARAIAETYINQTRLGS